MLRLYKPIEDDIFKLHDLFAHVIKEVWCQAGAQACEEQLEEAFKNIYTYSYKKKPLKDEVERIYELFRVLSEEEKQAVKAAFDTNNQIEDLCNGTPPVYLRDLPPVVDRDIKPLMVWCYNYLLDQSKVTGDKKTYYKALIRANDFHNCPCCGLVPFEGEGSKRREEFDHYLPKSIYPFASINFWNLIPLCHKCNSDIKDRKDPIKEGRKVFYPFSTTAHTIGILTNLTLDIDDISKNLTFDDLDIQLEGDRERLDTWDWLFDIKERYKERIKQFTKRFLAKIKKSYGRQVDKDTTWTMNDTLDEFLTECEEDYFFEENFLKIALLNAIKADPAFLQVYQ